MKMYPSLNKFITELDQEISKERKVLLQVLIDYVQKRKDTAEPIKLNFICTHNSRRSHLCQVWAKTMAAYFGVRYIKSYSGGTDETAVYHKIAETLINQGFEIQKLGNGTNATYKLSFDSDSCPMTLFSKKYDDSYNPKQGYAAVMTCNDADQNCPIIFGEQRISLPFIDPKVSDGTERQAEVYAERSTQIASEMKYVFSQIK